MEQLNIFSFEKYGCNSPININKKDSDVLDSLISKSYFGKIDSDALLRAKKFIRATSDYQMITNEIRKAMYEKDWNYRNILVQVIRYEDLNNGTLRNLTYPELDSEVLIPKGSKWELARVLKKEENNMYLVRPVRERATNILVHVSMLKELA